MTLSHEDEEGMRWHPYWYAKVLKIFHVNMRRLGSMETECMEFLWVHWFGHDLDHEGGFETHRLHCIRLTDSKDPASYEFLNPSDVLRAIHLIPSFSSNQTNQDADNSDNSDNLDNSDYEPIQEFYVSMFVIHLFIKTNADRYPGLLIVICSCDL